MLKQLRHTSRDSELRDMPRLTVARNISDRARVAGDSLKVGIEPSRDLGRGDRRIGPVVGFTPENSKNSDVGLVPVRRAAWGDEEQVDVAGTRPATSTFSYAFIS
jgi:hypothetical protein